MDSVVNGRKNKSTSNISIKKRKDSDEQC
jgi:hypothetical protein